MKVMTILGTRPEIIRLSLIIKRLDQMATKHVLVHTGQNDDWRLSQVFFDELKVRSPDVHIRLTSYSFGAQVGEMFAKVEQVIVREKPDCLLVLGDTNSALCAMLGERRGIPVYHMEAGNRCYNREVPEELNRKVIDAVATFNLPYTSISRDNLIREGIPPHRIWVTGNPICEVIRAHQEDICKRMVLEQMGLEGGKYFLATAHRAENVDRPERLKAIVCALKQLSALYGLPVVMSVHPRTRQKMKEQNIAAEDENLLFCEPFGFLDFVQLEKHALCVVTDSGTVQEESCILQVPAVTVRESTERPETVLCGSNVIAGMEPARIVECVNLMLNLTHTWELPEGYGDLHVSEKVTRMVLGGLFHVLG